MGERVEKSHETYSRGIWDVDELKANLGYTKSGWKPSGRIWDISELFSDVEYATGFVGRLKGLIGKKTVPDGYALIFERCSSVHSFFMSCTIDIMYLDEKDVVLGCQTLKPWCIGKAPKGTYSVVECAKGWLTYKAVCKGDLIVR